MARSPVCRTGIFGFVDGISPHDDRGALTFDHGYTNFEVENRNPLYVLSTWRGVVLCRAVTTLRTVETQTYAWGFVFSVRRDPTAKNRERENSEIGARTKRREMADRKFRETITKAEHYIRKHSTTMYIRGCTLTHTEKENIMKRSL